MQVTIDEMRKGRDPWFNKDEATGGDKNSPGFLQESHGRGEVMQDIKAENIANAGGPKGEFLCISDCLQPRTPNQIRGDHAGQQLAKKTWPAPDLDANPPGLPE